MLKCIQSIVVALVFFMGAAVWACSSFEFGRSGQGGLAHNFDWYVGMGSVAAFYVNARHVNKSGVNFYSSDPVAHWTSKYGSVTYTIVGREFPVGGQNEKGLVVQTQQIQTAQYPAGPLPVLDALQWPQYVLDTAATVEEAIENAKLVRPVSFLNLHFIVCDASAACAVIEFMNGRMLSYTGNSLKVRALTNNDYPASLDSWNKCPSGDCHLTDNSLQRFIESAALSEEYSSQEPLSYAMRGLEEVAQSTNPSTRYHFFNPAAAAGRVFFSSGNQTQWQSIDLSGMDYSCASAGRYFEIDLAGTGDQTTKFAPYDIKEQKKLVGQVPAKPDWVPTLINYPSTTTCKD